MGMFDSIFGGGSNVKAPEVNPVNTYNPFGSTVWSGKNTQTTSLSPELQSLFDKQFSPGSYDQYGDQYMGRYNELIEPYRENETDQFQQGMFNRGLPEGSEGYKDAYLPIGDARSRQDLMAAQQAMGYGDSRRDADYRRLMGAMGTQQPVARPYDPMGEANLQMNANMYNAQGQSDIWNTAAMLGGAYVMGAPDDSWLWS